MAGHQWVYVGGKAGNMPSANEKRAITAACERLIAEQMLPRFLPEIKPTKFNYPIAIYGKWHRNMYRFMMRYRCDRPDAAESEFEIPFSRIEFVSAKRFDVSYFRHTGRWHCIFQAVTLDEALRLIAEEGMLQPPV